MNDHTPNTPPDLEPVADRLDALARAERDAAPRDLATRLARAATDASSPGVLARLGWLRTPRLRVAAVLAIGAVGVVAVVLSTNTPTAPPASPEADFDALVAEGVSALRTALDSEPVAGENPDDFWSMGITDADTAFDAERSLWDLGDDALDTTFDWPDDEETL